MRVQIIVNPHSGRGRGVASAEAVASELRAAGWKVSSVTTSGPGHASDLAREALATHDLLLACGGDGTLCEVLNGVFPHPGPVGFIPAGTGNDLCRGLGLSRQPHEVARQLLAGRPRPLDLMRLSDPPIVSINVIGIGFDAAVAERMNRGSRAIGGPIPYLSAVMAELVRMRTVKLKLRLDGETWEGEALLVAVANARSYGGGMQIAPHASMDDGLLDVVIVEPLGRLDFLRTLPRVFSGTHLDHPAVSCHRGRELLVESTEPLPIMVDGDVRARAPLHVTLLPGAVNLWLPDRATGPPRGGWSRATQDSLPRRHVPYGRGPQCRGPPPPFPPFFPLTSPLLFPVPAFA